MLAAQSSRAVPPCRRSVAETPCRAYLESPTTHRYALGVGQLLAYGLRKRHTIVSSQSNHRDTASASGHNEATASSLAGARNGGGPTVATDAVTRSASSSAHCHATAADGSQSCAAASTAPTIPSETTSGPHLLGPAGVAGGVSAAATSSLPPDGVAASGATTKASSQAGSASVADRVFAWLRRLVTEQYLPLMLLGALLAAAVKPSWGLAASRTSLQSAVTFAIFVLQGVMLRRGEAEKALGAAGAISWGLASILLVTPLVAPLMGALPLQPPGLALGLLVFACMPTTLSSGVALTQVLGGNTALALLLTIASNLASVFTLPLLLPWALQASASLGGFGASAADAAAAAGIPSSAGAGGGAACAGSVRLDPGPLLVQLVQCILAPTLAGAGLRAAAPGLRSWVDSNRRTLSVISGALLSLVPWMQVSKALSQGVVVAPLALAAAVGASLVMHAGFLGLNTAAAQLLRLGGSDPRVAAPTRRALIIVASQKTLPVAMAVLGRLGPAVGAEAAGCAAVTAVFSHLAQTCADFWLVSRWTEHIRSREQSEAAAEAASRGAGRTHGQDGADVGGEGRQSLPGRSGEEGGTVQPAG